MTDLPALRDKYERMLRLRLLHLRAREEPGFVEPDPRPAMAELARRFPGALREIDELPLAVIRARIVALAAAETDAAHRAPWMHAHTRFHALTRGALAVKRWLGGRVLTPSLVEAFERELVTMPEPETIACWQGQLARIARPPRGRIMDLVYAKLADELGTDVASAREAVMPPPRSRGSLRGRRA